MTEFLKTLGDFAQLGESELGRECAEGALSAATLSAVAKLFGLATITADEIRERMPDEIRRQLEGTGDEAGSDAGPDLTDPSEWEALAEQALAPDLTDPSEWEALVERALAAEAIPFQRWDVVLPGDECAQAAWVIPEDTVPDAIEAVKAEIRREVFDSKGRRVPASELIVVSHLLRCDELMFRADAEDKYGRALTSALVRGLLPEKAAARKYGLKSPLAVREFFRTREYRCVGPHDNIIAFYDVPGDVATWRHPKDVPPGLFGVLTEGGKAWISALIRRQMRRNMNRS